jgi:hypothetical protein
MDMPEQCLTPMLRVKIAFSSTLDLHSLRNPPTLTGLEISSPQPRSIDVLLTKAELVYRRSGPEVHEGGRRIPPLPRSLSLLIHRHPPLHARDV